MRPIVLLATALLAASCSERETEPQATQAEKPPLAEPSATPDEPLSKGDSLPRITGIAQTGAGVGLGDDHGRVSLVFTCESLATARCTRLSKWLRDRWLDLRELDALVLGVTRDHRVKLRELAYELELPFYVLADPSGRLFRAFGLEQAGPVFVVDKNNEIQARLTMEPPEALAERALSSLASLSRDSG